MPDGPLSRRRPLAALIAGGAASLAVLAPPATAVNDLVDKSVERGSQARSKSIERQIRGCTNRKRIKHGLPTLAPAKPLEEAANFHAESMRDNGFFGHVDPSGRDAADRVGIFGKKARFVPIGENIAAGQNGARGVCKAWMKSDGHRANILDPGYEVIGAGYARGGAYGSYYVQVFGRER